MKAGPHSAGSVSTATACGSDAISCSGLTMQVPVAGHGAEGVVHADARVVEMLDLLGAGIGQAVDGRWSRESNSATGQAVRMGQREPRVTMLVAPGPMELAATMIWRRRLALRRRRGERHRLLVLAAPGRQFLLRGFERLPRQVTLPWPKMAKTPGNSGRPGRRPPCAGRSGI